MKLILKVALIGLVMMSFTATSKTDLWYTKTGKITFFSTTPVEDIKATNNQVFLAFNQTSGEISAKVTIKSFKFQKKLMQEHFNENYMESDKFPYANYKGTIEDIDKINFAKDTAGNFIKPATYNVKTTGKLTIHGVTKEVASDGKIVLSGKQATIKTVFSVLLADYNIEKPSVVAMKIADKIEVTLESDCKNK